MNKHDDLLGDLGIVFRALWDSPWHDLNRRQVESAYNKVDEAIQEYRAMREIVEAVAHHPMTYDFWTCPHCDQQFVWGMGMEGKHTDACIVTRARELLQKSTEDMSHWHTVNAPDTERCHCCGVKVEPGHQFCISCERDCP